MTKAIMEEEELYHWMQEQKENYKKGILTDEQIKKLESLSGWSWN